MYKGTGRVASPTLQGHTLFYSKLFLYFVHLFLYFYVFFLFIIVFFCIYTFFNTFVLLNIFVFYCVVVLGNISSMDLWFKHSLVKRENVVVFYHSFLGKWTSFVLNKRLQTSFIIAARCYVNLFIMGFFHQTLVWENIFK